jgi:hypothetical protein
LKRVAAIKVGNPLDAATQMGAQASEAQRKKILDYIMIGKQERALVALIGARRRASATISTGELHPADGVFGHNKMRVFQEEIFGPVVSVTTFKTEEEALQIANDTPYGLGAGVWSRNGNIAYRMGAGDSRRAGVDQLLSRLSGPRRVRRLQGFRLRPRNPPDDAGALPGNQESLLVSYDESPLGTVLIPNPDGTPRRRSGAFRVRGREASGLWLGGRGGGLLPARRSARIGPGWTSVPPGRFALHHRGVLLAGVDQHGVRLDTRSISFRALPGRSCTRQTIETVGRPWWRTATFDEDVGLVG